MTQEFTAAAILLLLAQMEQLFSETLCSVQLTSVDVVHPLSPRNTKKPRRSAELRPKVPRAVIRRPGLRRPVPVCREPYGAKLTLQIELFLLAVGGFGHQLKLHQAF